MAIKTSKGEKAFTIFNFIFMCFLMLVTIYPVLYVVFASFSDPKLLLAHEGILWHPLGGGTLKGYEVTLRGNTNLFIGYRNTIIYILFGTTLNVFMTGLAAYVLSRPYFMVRKVMTIMIVITMFFSGGMIPMFFIVKSLGMYDTPLALLLPSAINTYNLIIMRTFFEGIPPSLEEAAIIDGANDFDIFVRVILPLSKPVIAVMVLYYGVARWNAWFDAMLYLRNRSLMPLQIFLREILSLGQISSTATDTSQMVEESLYKELIQYCTIVLSTLPILCIYPFLQKYFVKGVMIGAVKG